MQTKIFIQTQFSGVHMWPDAPAEVSYLRNLHRHMFHVTVKVDVFHDDRELEFIMLKHHVEALIKGFLEDPDKWPDTTSCEQMAADIAKSLQETYGVTRSYEVTVSEDGENGAIVFLEAGDYSYYTR